MNGHDPDAIAQIYATTRDRLVSELRSLGAAQASTVVPSCPQWTVKDVVAHLAGLVADVIAQIPPPLGSDEMTARQVAQRSAATLDEICDEWVANADAIVPYLVDPPLRGLGLTADLAVHAHDLTEALEVVSAPPPEATAAACERYVPLLQERAAERLDLALTVDLDGQVWAAGAGSVPLGLAGSKTDFLRSVTGRRTRSDAEAAFVWAGDPTELLDRAFTQYGPFRAS